MELVRVTLAAVAISWLTACGDGGDRADISSLASVSTTEPSTTVASTTTQGATTTTAPSSTTERATTSVPGTTTRRPTTTRAPTTTAAGGAAPACSAAQLEVTATTDKTSYRPGETVRFQGILRNRSGAPCTYTSYTASSRIDGPSGTPVRPSAILVADAFRDTQLAAGATLSHPGTWDQQACPSGGSCSQAPPGTYTARVGWGFSGPAVEGSAAFQLVP